MNYPRRKFSGAAASSPTTPPLRRTSPPAGQNTPAIGRQQRPNPPKQVVGEIKRNHFTASPDDVGVKVFSPRPPRPIGNDRRLFNAPVKNRVGGGTWKPNRNTPSTRTQNQIRPATSSNWKPSSKSSGNSFNRRPGARSGRHNDQSAGKISLAEENKDGIDGGSDEGGIKKEKAKKIPPLAPGDIRIIPLGGVEEIGKNMTAIEIDGDIIIIDEGLLFPGDDAPGVDYIIPDTTYLEERKHMIRGVVITHGHLDHIGGVPYIQPKIGNPPIYTSILTAVMIKKRQEEFPQLPKLNMQVVTHKDVLRLGKIKVRFFETTHTIPDSLGIIIETPHGNIVATGDFKLEHDNGVPIPAGVAQYEQLAKEKTLLLITESTNVERPGFSFPETEVQKNVREIVEKVNGRIIIGSFASLFERIFYIILACEELGKKVAIEGRSMKTNIEISKELGILKVKKGTLISTEEIGDYPDNQIVILATGAQGDEFAALMRMSQAEHKAVKIRKGDTVLLSSSVIPGNEKSVQKLKDNLSRLGAKIIHYGIANVHSSGHCYQGELLWIEKKLKPKFLIPVHGHHHMLRIHADVGMEAGIPENNIIVADNGSIIEISADGQQIKKLKETVSSHVVMVDGIGTNDVKEVVIRDRQMLSEDGMFVLIAIIDMKTGKVKKSPDIISRGFIYLKENQDMLRHVRMVTKKTIETATAHMHPLNLDYLKNAVREELGKYLFQKTHKRPIILPVLIEV